ncbi:methyltransferase [Methylosinus sp. 3S-1]|nr:MULTISPECIES: methyltransferase [Methylosinus]
MNVHRATNVPPSSEQPAPTHDLFLAGRLRLRQTPRGHRAGTDAVLLAAAVTAERRGLVIDAGAGTGAVGLAAALRAATAEVALVEIDPEAAALARANIAENDATRVRLCEADLLSPASRRAAGIVDEAADLVLTNPPFLDPARSRVSPDPRRALAHVAAGGLEPWLRACLALLRPGGELALIHRADALTDCLAGLGARLGGLRILPVAPRAGEPATRILLRGVKGSKAPLALLAPLVLHEADGAFTREAEALARGDGSLPW